MVYNHETAEAFLAKGRNKDSRKIANNTRVERLTGDIIGVRLHATCVVKYHPSGNVELDSGGWRTVTTKDRINRHATADLYSNKGTWLVGYFGKSYFFADGMLLKTDGTVEGAPEFDAEQVIAANRKRGQLTAKAKRYVKLFLTGKPVDFRLLDEAAENFGLSIAAKELIEQAKSGYPVEGHPFAGIVDQQITSAVKRQLWREGGFMA